MNQFFIGCLEKRNDLDEKTRDFAIEIVRDVLSNQKDAGLALDWEDCYQRNIDDDRIRVVLMDSHLFGVVYNKWTLKSGGSNADDITDVIKDLPIEIYKESTNRNWTREKQVFEDIKPQLIILHLSAFYAVTNVEDPEGDLKRFIDNAIKKSDTKILVYTRGPEDLQNRKLMARWESIKTQFRLRWPPSRVTLYEFHLPYDKVDFRDSKTSSPFKTKVEELVKQIAKERTTNSKAEPTAKRPISPYLSSNSI